MKNQLFLQEDEDDDGKFGMKNKNVYKKQKNELLSKSQYEVVSDRDLFRKPTTTVVCLSRSTVNPDELFQFMFHIWTHYGLTPQQASTIIQSTTGKEDILKAFTHYSFLPQDKFHDSNDYFERMGTYVLDQHLQRHLLMTQGSFFQKGLEEKFSLILSWFQSGHKAVPFADQLRLTEYIQWGNIQISNDYDSRIINLSSVVKWSVFSAFVWITEKLADEFVGLGVGELVVNNILKDCWKTFEVNIENMAQYKDDKSQIVKLHNELKKFFLEDSLETVNHEKIYKVSLSLNQDMSYAERFTYFLGQENVANLSPWKLTVCADIKAWLKSHHIEWS
jgi:dsRNA-specific ribonuclease